MKASSRASDIEIGTEDAEAVTVAAGTETSGVDITVNAPTALPAKDNFADGGVIANTPFTDTVDTRGATGEIEDPTPPCGRSSRGKSVWYQFTPANTGVITADTLGSSYDTVPQ